MSPLPQPHSPVERQVSARIGSHATQATPLIPHVANDRVWHALLAQQPLGQEVTSQLHAPLTQCWPEPQTGSVPHRQAPPLEQVSARMASQPTHAAPPMPHAPAVGGLVQVTPEQHPVEQLDELQVLHTPPLQLPGVQSWQAPPLVPQAVSVVPVRQLVPEQHPFAHEVPSQMHALLKQRWPVPHAELAPHWQVPLAVQLSALIGSQAIQLAPPVPHVPSDRVLQVDPVQHPVPHEVPSQMHEPPEQLWPAPHAGLFPHAHEPDDVQLSALLVSQRTQVAPPVPHVVSDRISHTSPVQQPAGHDATSQTHEPPEQLWPAPQAAPVPQPHPPLDRQLSALARSQPTHPAPAIPHELAVGGALQVAPEQQPDAQLLGVHPVQIPLLQVPGRHDWHAAPPLPQAALSLDPARHVVSEQQPAHETESQMQVPPEQRCPAPQGADIPHWQAPVDEQLSALAASHAAHVAPLAPHVLSDRVLQVVPEQQPATHDVPSHTHAPDTQR